MSKQTYEGKWGHYKADGSVVEPTRCMLTGQLLHGKHTIRQRVEKSPYFYRVLSKYAHRVTDDQRTTWASATPKAQPDKDK